MARVFQTGFEIGPHTALVTGFPDGYSGNGAVTGGTVVRTGAKALVLTANQSWLTNGNPMASSVTVYMRAYIRKTANPTVAGVFFECGNRNVASIFFETNGTLTLRNVSGVQSGSASAALANDTWYLLELKLPSSSADTAEARLNGVSFGTPITGSTSSFIYGPTFTGLTGCTIYVDDVAVNDTTGSVNNSWCGAGKVALLSPISDNNVGSWLTAAAGATNLYDAVNNTPPTGSAASDALRIESVDSSGDNATDEYRANLTTYSTAGVASTDDVRAVIAWVCHGEEAATGAKTGSFGLQSNPSQSYATINPYGPSTSGALGTYPTNWVWQAATAVEFPAVTLGNSPVIAARKTDTGTRSASITGMFAYVEYAPHISSLVPPPPTARLMHLLAR